MMGGENERPPFPAELGSEPDAGDLEEVWSLLDDARADAGFVDNGAALDQAWARLAGEIQGLEVDVDAVGPTSPGSGAERSSRRLAPVWGLVAAAAAAIFVMVGPPATITVEAGPGESRSVTLADGSLVELNSGSMLSYARWVTGGSPRARRVHLDGEAFLQVVPGDAQFLVRTFNAEVTVLGTAFNVRAREEPGGGTDVAVQSGRVRLAAAGIGKGVEMEGGYAASVELGATEPGSPTLTRLEPVLSWRTRGFAAVDLPLGSILAELERRFDTRLEVSEGVALDERLTVHYQEPSSLESILRDIATARGLGFRAISGGYEIHP